MAENSNQKYLIRDPQGNVYGPADAALLRDWVGQGRIVAGMFIADRETRQWIEASTHPIVADLLQAKTPRPAQPIRPAQPTPPRPASTSQPRPAAPAQPKPSTSGEIELRPIQTPVRPAPAPMPQQPVQYYTPANGGRQNLCALIGFIASLVGAVAVLFSCVPLCGCVATPISALLEVSAVVLGSIGLYQVRENPESYPTSARGLAMAALIIGAVVLVLYIIGVIAVVALNLVHRP
ncbi:MAG TPA: hypothetical protein VHM90_07650 [Phycisphaerae bacterium]|nr:hypothetical protein [Phycisphaerae bacterium]